VLPQRAAQPDQPVSAISSASRAAGVCRAAAGCTQLTSVMKVRLLLRIRNRATRSHGPPTRVTRNPRLGTPYAQFPGRIALTFRSLGLMETSS
jgi:hypothetical protein